MPPLRPAARMADAFKAIRTSALQHFSTSTFTQQGSNAVTALLLRRVPHGVGVGGLAGVFFDGPGSTAAGQQHLDGALIRGWFQIAQFSWCRRC